MSYNSFYLPFDVWVILILIECGPLIHVICKWRGKLLKIPNSLLRFGNFMAIIVLSNQTALFSCSILRCGVFYYPVNSPIPRPVGHGFSRFLNRQIWYAICMEYGELEM
jgi:hypothetical protein